MDALSPVVLASIQAVGWTLLHFVWQGALVGAVYALLRHRLPAARSELRYGCGVAALAVLAACPVVTLPWLLAQVGGDAATLLARAASPVASIGAESGLAQPPVAGHWLPWLVAAWFLGVVAMAWRAHAQWRSLSRIVRQAVEPDSELLCISRALARRFGLTRAVRIAISARIDTPTLIGWITPVILLPASVVLALPRQQLELILAHELAHLRRYDHLVNLAQSVLETVLYYHPVVHWISRDVRNEREICCDRLVLRADSSRAHDYARTLAALETLRGPTPRIVLAASGGILLDRVRRIVGEPLPPAAVPRAWSSPFGVMLLTALIAAGLVLTRMQQSSLEAGGASAGAILERLPRPAIGLLVDLAVQWHVAPSESRIQLAPLASLVAPPPAERRDGPILTMPAAVAREALSSDVQAFALPANALPREREAVVPAADPLPLKALSTPPASPAAPAAAAELAPDRTPVAIHRVTPSFPEDAPSRAQATVTVELRVDARGAVQSAQVVSGDASGPFARAARDAVLEWRFDPASVADGNATLRQDFVFAPAGPVDGAGALDCVMRTGSRICQR